jgi:hypothetical protein
MKVWQLACIACIVVGFTISAACLALIGKTPGVVPSNAAADAEVTAALPTPAEVSAIPRALSADEPSLSREESTAIETPAKDQARLEQDQAKLEEDNVSVRDHSAALTPPKPELSYLPYYVYSELSPDKKPADILLESLKDTPIGTPIEEVKRAADAFGLDFGFMKAVAKIESDFDPKQRTGQYIGLFQLNHYEFNKYGSGEITNPRDNAIAAAYKFVTEAALFEWDTHKKPTFSDLYLIHQQGWQGAAEHVGHPERIAWKSMCATDEGREKGDKWCKRAIWGNTLPALKHMAKSVDGLTSGAFVQMWRERVDHLYSRYSDATVGETKH